MPEYPSASTVGQLMEAISTSGFGDEYKRIIAADPGFFDPSLVEKDGRKAAMTG